MQDTSCHGFPTIQLYILFYFGVIGFFSNTMSAIYFVKNFTMSKTIHRVILMDSIVCIICFLALIGIVLSFLTFPDGICGQNSCFFIQLAVLIPFIGGHFFLAQISLLRKITVAASMKRNQQSSEKNYGRIVLVLTVLPILYLTIIFLVNGPDGIIYKVLYLTHITAVSSPLGMFCDGRLSGLSQLLDPYH